MNNKSTENLIISNNGSIEELFVPPLNLENKKKTTSVSDQSTDSEQNHITNLVIHETDLHASNEGKVEPKLKKIPPIPAARKSLLPPIASKRSDKEVKNDQNQLRKKKEQNESDDIAQFEVVNEHKKCFVDARSDSNSQTDTENTASSKIDHITLSSLSKKEKGQIKNQLVNLKANAETTSFISHEEKHKNEDLSEHLSLNRSAEELNTKEASNEHLLDIEDSTLPKRKSQKKSSKVTKGKKSKKKNRKSNRARDKSPEQLQSPNKKNEVYDFKNVIGIWLHETSAFKFDQFIRLPRIRVSIYDLNEGNLLAKSNPLRNAVLNYEPTNVTFIQPILSNHCRLKDTSWIECDWSDELLIINEDIRHIEKDHIVIFFEILDIISDRRHRTDWNGWYSINWAFLKPGDAKTYSNLNKRCTLQLYYYQKRRKNHSILDEWKTVKKIKYPGNLSVTVGSYKPELTRSVSLTRPMSVLEEEVTGDIYTQGSDNEELETIHGNNDEDIDVKPQTTGKKVFAASHLESRLPGQLCECPNRLMYRHELEGEKRYRSSHEQYGSMIAKFSPTGHLLAFHCTTYRRHNHKISIINVNNLKINNTLIGHLNIVYDLEWLNENVLVSVSSDRTAIVWFLYDRGEFTLKILPHPSFVYTVKWLHTPHDYVLISTGGRDCVLRIWKMNLANKDDDIELNSELIQHEDYITSLLTNRKSSRLYSADWAGVLHEWSHSKSKSKMEPNASGQSFQFRRQMKVFPTSILRIELHPKSNRIFVQCLNDPLIYVIDITSAIVTQTIKTALETRQTFTISPCGTFIFTNCMNNDQIKCIHILDAKEGTHFRLPISLTAQKYLITSLTFHPTKNIIACTLFGSLMDFCLYLMYHDNGNIHEKSIAEDLRLNLNFIDQWNGLRSKDSIIFGSEAIEAILHRIDDLFCIAIQSPKHFAEYEQLKQMQMDLEKIQQPLRNLDIDEKELENVAKDFQKNSNGSIKIFEIKHLSEEHRSHAKNLDINATQSTSSNQTFTLEKKPQQTETVLTFNEKSKESEKSSQTYSINSDRSNLTFDVQKKKK